MKVLRNIFISTTVLVILAFTVILTYLRMIMNFNPDTFKLLLEFAVMVAVISIAVSMAIHRTDLAFAFKLVKLPESERFASIEEWKKADEKLAVYPRVQGLGTILMWLVGTSITGLIFYFWRHYITFREMIYIIAGGIIMGSICGGYNYFFFKLHLTPLRRTLSPTTLPENWKPAGSMRRMLSAAFISICMALTLFPAAVIYVKMDELHWDSIHKEGMGLLRIINAQISRTGAIQKGKLSPEATAMLSKIAPAEYGYVILLDNGGKTLYGSRSEISENSWARMNTEKSGDISDSETNLDITFGPVGTDVLKAAVVYPRKGITESSLKFLRFIGKVIGIALFMAVGLIFLIRQYFGGAVERLVSELDAVAEGDLQKRIPVCSDGEMGTLEKGLGSMKQKLVELIETQGSLVERIGFGVEKLVKATDELREVAGEQATAAAEQASAAQEAGVTSEEVKTSSGQIADRASSVSEMAEETLGVTTKGAGTASETVEEIRKVEERVGVIADKMLELGENIQNIGKIADTIEEISQNNQLLAINAAIEAVGAGSEGERFGVVAGEIRNLANFTAQSAEQVRLQVGQIRKTAAESVIYTEEGTKSASDALRKVQLVASTFATLEDIARKTSQNAREINMSTRQQATATSQMALTMNELNDTAVQVAESARKVEVAAKDLDGLAEELKNIVSDKMGGTGAGNVPKP